MITKIKKKWLKGLRSEEYKQGRGSLKQGDLFCCLGVLCDIHRKETKGNWIDGGEGEEAYMGSNYKVLPSEVRSWAGLLDVNPSVEGYGLAHFNDEVGLNFNQIADLIEKNL